jgi:hypothetical protein
MLIILIECLIICIVSFSGTLKTVFLLVIEVIDYRIEQNDLIMKSINISRERKINLYIIYRNTNNLQVKEYYKKCCVILRRVIIDARNYITIIR